MNALHRFFGFFLLCLFICHSQAFAVFDELIKQIHTNVGLEVPGTGDDVVEWKFREPQTAIRLTRGVIEKFKELTSLDSGDEIDVDPLSVQFYIIARQGQAISFQNLQNQKELDEEKRFEILAGICTFMKSLSGLKPKKAISIKKAIVDVIATELGEEFILQHYGLLRERLSAGAYDYLLLHLNKKQQAIVEEHRISRGSAAIIGRIKQQKIEDYRRELGKNKSSDPYVVVTSHQPTDKPTREIYRRACKDFEEDTELSNFTLKVEDVDMSCGQCCGWCCCFLCCFPCALVKVCGLGCPCVCEEKGSELRLYTKDGGYEKLK